MSREIKTSSSSNRVSITFHKNMEQDTTAIFPLADRIRPGKLEEFVGQPQLLGQGKIIRSFLDNQQLSSLILWGPPGTGKTTLSRILVKELDFPSVEFSATVSGINEIREIMKRAAEVKKMYGKPLVLFVDEIHHFNKHTQDAFLPYVERGDIVLLGTTTENPAFKINRALLSRLKILEFFGLEREDLNHILEKARDFIARHTGQVIDLPENVRDIMFHYSSGDARRLLNLLEITLHLVVKEAKPVTEEMVLDVIQNKIGAYDRSGDDRYQLISAFHKSVRNSDLDASLFWLYRMLTAGEDPLYILRRMIRICVEDIGLADPEALKICLNARDAYEYLGSPEGDLFLTEVAVYLVAAPKSNSLYVAGERLKKVAEKYRRLSIPLHIINPDNLVAAKKGAGKGYLYAHDFKEKTTIMETLPDGLPEKDFFTPNEAGFEKKIKERLDFWKTLKESLQKKQKTRGEVIVKSGIKKL